MSPGISFILPTFQGVSRVRTALNSIWSQSATKSLIQVVVVVNGDDDGTIEAVSDFSARHPDLEVQVLRTSPAGASRARNAGLSIADRHFITFLDDDDALEERFVEKALAVAEPNSIVLMPFIDCHQGKRIESNRINERIRRVRSRTPVSAAPWALGFNAAKVLPRSIATRYRYAEELASGEDVVFFSNLLRDPELIFVRPPDDSDCAYLRTIRENSLSRDRRDFEFCVQERLAVINRLNSLRTVGAEENALKSLITSQQEFVRRYAKAHPESKKTALDAVIRHGLGDLDWKFLHPCKPKRLIISYCFPPFADPSGNVVAKRILQSGDLVDVIHADMSSVRSLDKSLLDVVSPLIAQSFECRNPVAFSNWSAIEAFTVSACEIAENWHLKRQYEELYSRSHWPASHSAAALFKLRHSEVTWTAEFSDPLSTDVYGEARPAEEARGPMARVFESTLLSNFSVSSEGVGHLRLIELVTLLLADQLVFTNPIQADLVLETLPESISREVRKKIEIRAQPTLEKSFYRLREAKVDRARGAVNVGYFGSFYDNRGVGHLLGLIEEVNGKLGRTRVVLHVFTNNPHDVPSSEAVRTYPALEFLDFLNALTRVDVLLVMDAMTKGGRYETNPFIPSKLADYSGAGVPIWSLAERGSMMSKMVSQYQSWIDDTYSINESLSQIIFDHVGIRLDP